MLSSGRALRSDFNDLIEVYFLQNIVSLTRAINLEITVRKRLSMARDRYRKNSGRKLSLIWWMSIISASKTGK